ncbi:MAG: 2-oxoacid:ferredoxin oxidoreductase subunit beta [Dehalococcoidia bacterium]|nr:2-oxoacid:ferredoxin oxidoreductase subunit beta [Dehalococcoidia bacterium]
MIAMQDYAGGKPAWCPGCGNFGILSAVQKALVELQIDPHQVLMVSGIGQAGKLPHYINVNVFNSLHGRALPVAIGAKMANPDLKVIAVGGDGDGYAEGGNHFIHTVRRNHDITYIVHNNQVYALTKGQASPTSDFGFVTKTTPQGADPSFNPLAVAIALGAGFVARGFAGDIEHLSKLIVRGIEYKGFALIDVLQPCISFNHLNTFAWYKQRVYKVEENGYQPTGKAAGFEKAQEWGERIPIGVIYLEEKTPFESRIPALQRGPLVQRPLDPMTCAGLLEEFI